MVVLTLCPEQVAAPELKELLLLDQDSFAARFEGSPIKRIGLARMVPPLIPNLSTLDLNP